ncbi:hypothetical protein TNCV_3314341 [Trichonephila clavipes]|nr:hypothetical protein TNCV_3314341 [Trichonephila clavipes]
MRIQLLSLYAPSLIEDEAFNDSDIINNLIDYEDGQEVPDSLRADKIYADSDERADWMKSITNLTNVIIGLYIKRFNYFIAEIVKQSVDWM